MEKKTLTSLLAGVVFAFSVAVAQTTPAPTETAPAPTGTAAEPVCTPVDEAEAELLDQVVTSEEDAVAAAQESAGVTDEPESVEICEEADGSLTWKITLAGTPVMVDDATGAVEEATEEMAPMGEETTPTL